MCPKPMLEVNEALLSWIGRPRHVTSFPTPHHPPLSASSFLLSSEHLLLFIHIHGFLFAEC